MMTDSILVITLGGQPQVLTFTLDDLYARGEAIREVIAVHMATDDPRIQRSLVRILAEFQSGAYRGNQCSFRHIVIRSDTSALVQIDDDVTAEVTWQTVHRLVAELKAKRCRLHLCVTGGPRIIGLMALSAAMLQFDHLDRVWHLYTPRELRERARDGAIMHAQAGDGIRLIQVPIAPWGAYFPALRALSEAPSWQAIAAQTSWLDESERSRCESVVARLTPRQVEVLRAFADGLSPQDVAERLVVTIKTVDTHKTAILDECRSVWNLPQDGWLTYHFLRDKFMPYFRTEPG